MGIVMTMTVDELNRVARHVRIDALNAVLEKVTQLQAAGKDIDEVAWWLKGALGWMVLLDIAFGCGAHLVLIEDLEYRCEAKYYENEI